MISVEVQKRVIKTYELAKKSFPQFEVIVAVIRYRAKIFSQNIIEINRH